MPPVVSSPVSYEALLTQLEAVIASGGASEELEAARSLVAAARVPMKSEQRFVIYDWATHDAAAMQKAPASEVQFGPLGEPLTAHRRRPFALAIHNEAAHAGRVWLSLAPLGVEGDIDAEAREPSMQVTVEVNGGLPCVHVHPDAFGRSEAMLSVFAAPERRLAVRRDEYLRSAFVRPDWLPSDECVGADAIATGAQETPRERQR